MTFIIVGLLAISQQRLPTAQAQDRDFPITTLSIGKFQVKVEIAANDIDRAQGLMFRERLSKDEGMLFVFEETASHCFWMKNTKIPLSVAFIDEYGVISDIDEMQPGTTTHHCPAQAGRYALEMNHDWFASKDIKPGAFVSGLPH